MNEIFLLYLWTRLDSINITIGNLTVASIIVFAILLLYGAMEMGCAYGRESAAWKKGQGLLLITKRYSWILFLLIFLANAIPTKKDAAIIVGGWLVSKAVQTDQAKEIGDKTWRIIQGKLDEQLADMEKAAKK